MSDNFTQFPSSTSIQSCDYDEARKVLTVTFVRGKSYEYADVPKEEFERLKDAESPGKYFQAHIKPVYSVI